MSDEIQGTGTPATADSSPSQEVSFPTQWDTPVTVSEVDNSQQLPVDNSVDNSASVDTGKPVAQPNEYESRYKEVQGWATKVSQQNKEYEKALAVAQRDIEHLAAQLNRNSAPTPSPEDWQDNFSSREKFDTFLAQRDAALARIILESVPVQLESHPVVKEAGYRMGLDRTVAKAESEGVDFKSLAPEIEALMPSVANLKGVNQLQIWDHLYEAAKELATKNGKVFTKPATGVATRSAQDLKAKAQRLKTETNAASGDVKRLPSKEIDWKLDPRERMEQALQRALEKNGLG